MVNFMSLISRSAEKVSSPSLNLTSLSFDSFLSCQVIMPVSLSPSFLTARVDSRFCPPTSYSHFHVPTGSAFSSRAPAGRHGRATTAAGMFALMVASGGWGAGGRPTRPAPPADCDCREGTATGQNRAPAKEIAVRLAVEGRTVERHT